MDLNKIMAFLTRLRSRLYGSGDRVGQTLVEYSLILVIISVVIVGLIFNLGKQVTNVYSVANSALTTSQVSH